MNKSIEALPLVKGGLPFLGNVHQLKSDQIHLTFEHWAKEYGDYYRFKVFGKDVVVVCDLELVLEMLKNRLDPYNRPDNFVDTLKDLKIDSLFTNHIDDWELQRSLVTQSMNINKLRGAYEQFNEITRNLTQYWQAKAHEQCDINLILDIRKYTFDMLCAISLGHHSNSYMEGNNDFFQAMDTVFEAMNKGAQSPFKLWRLFNTRFNKNVKNSVSLIVSRIESIIKMNNAENKHIATSQDPCNILQSLIIENAKTDSQLTDSQLVGNIFALIGAGFHTVGNTISWLSYNLATQQELQNEIYKEALAYIEKYGEPNSFQYFSKLPLMNAFIKESMRLRPSAPLIFITTSEDIILGDIQIPKGTDIYAHTGYLSRSNKYFDNADQLNVHRWIDKSLPKSEHNERAYMPFSNGSTFCPGRNLAFLQIQMYLFNILRQFQVNLSENSKPIEEHYHIGVEPSKILLRLSIRPSLGLISTQEQEEDLSQLHKRQLLNLKRYGHE